MKNVFTSKRRTFEVEENMNNMQASLSSNSLMKPELDIPTYVIVDEKSVIQDHNSNLSDCEKQLTRKKRLMKMKKEQLRKMQDKG